jgi:hypothetical protein
MKYSYIILTALSILAMSVSAQVKISGTIVDSDTRKFVEYANLALLKEDSSFVAAASSDDQGLFAFNNIPAGSYILSASSLGYNKAFQSVNATEKDAKVGNVLLTPSSFALKDIIVTGHTIIQKADKKLILPSASQIKISNNGMTLLKNLQLPRIMVNPIDNTVTVPGSGAVQLRINGVVVTVAEITALSPVDIIRIEYHDDPGMRYGDAPAVLDYITRRRETGGSVSANLGNVLFQNLSWGENTISAKVNNKNSEFSVYGYWSKRGIDWVRENEETFIFPDKTLERKEVGQPTRFEQDRLNYALNYSLNEPDKYMLNVNLRNNYEHTPNSFSDRESILYSSDNATPLAISDLSSSRGNTPALDIYFQKNLKKEQFLIFNVVGTYIDSHSARTYRETRGNNLSTDIFSSVDGEKYSLIAEGIYEKTLKKGKISAGLKHSQSFTNNQYSGNVAADVNLHVAETYLYSEYQLRQNKLNYTFGIGWTRTFNSQENQKNESYIWRPTIRVNYTINNNAYVRYSSSVLSTAPSLSDLNNVEQNIDSLQIRKGNPDLHTVWFLSNKLNVGYSKGIFGLELFAHYLYYNEPMMEQVSYNGDKFVRMIINQKAMHQLYTQASLSLKPWKDFITLRYTPEFNRFVSKGNDYTHTFSYWRTQVSVNLNYKNYFAGAEIYSRWDNLWGEDLEYGERMHILTAGYNKPKWNITAMIFNPFSKRYDQSNRNVSMLAPSSSYVYTDNLAGTFVVRLSMNLNFGSKFKAVQKRLNNDDSDSGIMSGTKK